MPNNASTQRNSSMHIATDSLHLKTPQFCVQLLMVHVPFTVMGTFYISLLAKGLKEK